MRRIKQDIPNDQVNMTGQELQKIIADMLKYEVKVIYKWHQEIVEKKDIGDKTSKIDI